MVIIGIKHNFIIFVADKNGEEQDLDALISNPDLNNRANGNKVGASNDLLAISYLDDDEFEELFQRPPPHAPENEDDNAKDFMINEE
ncbi:hypothetical protein S245_015486 [Arachis hypogaea]